MTRIRPALLAAACGCAFAAASPSTAQLALAPVDLWHQTSAGIDLPAQADAQFGAALAAGDFDDDGKEDLAIGIPEYDLDELFDVGLVTILYGSDEGPTAVGKDLWTQDHLLLLDDGELDDRFGSTLAVGDFDADGFDDLAIGVPYESVGEIEHAGAVHILYGSSGGLSSTDQFFHQGYAGVVVGAPEEYDRFGSSLAVGDFDDDGYDDLAIGVPYESVGELANAGAFHVFFGGEFGLSTATDRLIYPGNGLPGTPVAGELLAWSLAAGDLDPSSPGDELAIGVPGATTNGMLGAGAIWIASNLDSASTGARIDLDSEGIPGSAMFGEQLGCAVAVGQFDGDDGEDLAATLCRRRYGSDVNDAGMVLVRYDGERPAILISQASMPDEEPELEDFFGIVLAVADFHADGVDDLVIGVPFENDGADIESGAVHVVPGIAGSGLNTGLALTIVQVASPIEPNDRFGGALVAGRFSGHSGTDLAIGSPGETYAGNDLAGSVHVLFSDALFLDGFEAGDPNAWSSTAGAP